MISELKTIRELQSQKHTLLYHRKKIGGIEMDVITFTPDGYLQITEVKSLSRWTFAAYRVTLAQKQRLARAKQMLEAQTKISTVLRLALVEEKEVTFLDLTF